jgi:hypothetical protein
VTTNDFLASLPAILGFTGFAVFWFLRFNYKGDATTRQVLAKVRRSAPDVAKRLERLRGQQLSNALEHDAELRQVLDAGDQDILRQALRQQFILSLVVLVLSAGLVAFALIMFLRQQSLPQNLKISNFLLESVEGQARGKAVDLDDLAATWKSAGEPEDLLVYLENVQTGRRSRELRTGTQQQRVVFPRETYRPCLDERAPGRSNRLRIVCQGQRAVFQSPEFDVWVGVNIWGFWDQEKGAVRLAAMIDHALVQGYAFEAKVIVWTKGTSPEVLSFGGPIRGMADFSVEKPEAIRWDTLSVTYLGPGDASLVRATTEPI